MGEASRQTTKPENHRHFNSAEKNAAAGGCGVETEIAVRNTIGDFSLSAGVPTSSPQVSNYVHTTQYYGKHREARLVIQKGLGAVY
jgi:hypothetical protein